MTHDESAFPNSAYLGVMGISKREYFAIRILAAAVSNPNTTCPWIGDFLVQEAYKMADLFIMEGKEE